MCGIAGFWDISSMPTEGRQAALAGMTDSLSHRGPDDSGTWFDARFELGLGHRRLSIIDPSPAGRQPMVDRSKRYTLTYNGEIYNYREIRTDLEKSGSQFISHSDTEVILEAVAAWGLDRTLERVNGMFAFALWDSQQRSLFLARDRLGIKPLYWTRLPKGIAFASQSRAFFQHPCWRPALDVKSAASFLCLNYVVAPDSIYKDSFQVKPAEYLRFDQSFEADHCTYWKNSDEPGAGLSVDQLERRLLTAVKRRMVADVPVGALLSGGVDSSLVTAMMCRSTSTRVKTFTIGQRDQRFDESMHAATIAQHLGTDHTCLQVDSTNLLDLVSGVSNVYDEPFGDSSQLPSMLVAKLASEHVKVVLTGDGADEFFAGYSRYRLAHRVLRLKKILPPSLVRLMSKFPGLRSISKRGYKVLHTLNSRSDTVAYQKISSGWFIDTDIVSNWSGAIAALPEIDYLKSADPRQLLAYDQQVYLPNDILVKVDRASMAYGLEARVPLLDHEFVVDARRYALQADIFAQQPKYLLRLMLQKYVPTELYDRPKMGFAVPMASWLRSELREVVQDQLSDEALDGLPFLNKKLVRQTVNEHMKGEADWKHQIWSLLMLSMWRNEWLP